MQSLAYSVKEVNAVAGCTLFVVAAICNLNSLSLTQEVWQHAFVNYDVLFYASRPEQGIVMMQLHC